MADTTRSRSSYSSTHARADETTRTILARASERARHVTVECHERASGYRAPTSGGVDEVILGGRRSTRRLVPIEPAEVPSRDAEPVE